MQELGFTRSVRQPDHFLLTKDTFIRIPVPGFDHAQVIVHVNPAAGAGFTQYTVEFEPEGCMGKAHGQRFVYVLEGTLKVTHKEREYLLAEDAYAYVPEGESAHIEALGKARAAVIEKPYIRPAIELPQPTFFVGNEPNISSTPLQNDEWLQVRALLPADMAFDFAVNTMSYEPGGGLPMVEIHVMEHGLLMLQGGGIYRLNDRWYPVTAGDFIWMAPYCPQWFGAIGKQAAKYLIYKDWNRHPLQGG